MISNPQMSNETGESSGSVGFEEKNKIGGLPKKCWCGEKVVLKQSKTENNPNRRYFRCSYAALNLLQSDKHLFKWLDYAMLGELGELNSKIAMLDVMVKEMSTENKEMEKLFERFEEYILQKVDNMMVESNRKMKSAMVVALGSLFIIGLVIKLIL